MTLQITDLNFENIISDSRLSVIMCSAPWCAVCRAITPSFDDIASQYINEVSVGKVNVDTDSVLASKFSVNSLPSLLFIKDGKLLDKQVGAITKSALNKKIQMLLNG